MAKSYIDKTGRRKYGKDKPVKPKKEFVKGTMTEFTDEDGNCKVYITFPYWRTVQWN